MKPLLITISLMMCINAFSLTYTKASDKAWREWKKSHPHHTSAYNAKKRKLFARKYAKKASGKKSVFEQNREKERKVIPKKKKRATVHVVERTPMRDKFKICFSIQNDNGVYYLKTTNDIGVVTIRIYQRLLIKDDKVRKVLIKTINASKYGYSNYRSIDDFELLPMKSKKKLLIVVSSSKCSKTKRFYKRIITVKKGK